MLCSCSSKITQGEVYKKNFRPAYSTVRLIPIVHTNGKTSFTTFMPFTYHYPGRWEINIRQLNDNGETLTATYWVSKDVFNTVKIGDEFVYDENRDFSEEPYTREEGDYNTD